MSDGRIPIRIFGVHIETLWLGLRTEICCAQKLYTARNWTPSHLITESHDTSEHLTVTPNGLVYSTYYLCNDHWMATIYRGGVFAAYRMWPKINISYITRWGESESGGPKLVSFLIRPQNAKYSWKPGGLKIDLLWFGWFNLFLDPFF